MVFLNGTKVTPKYFTDGSLDIKIDYLLLRLGEKNTIEWRYDNNEELIVVYFLARHLQTKGITDIDLLMPYIPYARKDRAQREIDVFSLKYFSEIINSLAFTQVIVLDPHSIVSEALIDRIRCITPEQHVQAVLNEIGDDTLMFYPDEGAVKRYADKIGKAYIYGMKTRDKTSRVIKSLRIEGDVEDIKEKNILMVDDICASGGTLSKAGKQLLEMGAKNLYVYVSHCENTVIGRELLDVITALYTTDSIIREEHPKIKVMAWDPSRR